MVVVHFIDVGQGNMTMVEMPAGDVFMYDCNITNDNAERVLKYIGAALAGRHISFFLNSHREADHMRGLKRLSSVFPIKLVCDNGLPGGTTNTTEYNEYMAVRRDAKQYTAQSGQIWSYGTGRVRVFNAANERLAKNPNAQSIVLKIENLNPTTGAVANSVILAGDSDAAAWENGIVPVFGAHLPSTILLGGHHGAPTFFTKSDGSHYTAHLTLIKPKMTVISVGDNTYGHPNPAALRLYEAGSTGSDGGTKIARTDLRGSIKLILGDDGSWRMTWTGPSHKPAPAPGHTIPTRGAPFRGLPRPVPNSPSPVRSLPGRPATILSGVRPPVPLSGLKSLSDALKIPPVPPASGLKSLADVLGIPPRGAPSLGDLLRIPAPTEPTLGEILAQLLKTIPPTKPRTPFEEFSEWLLRQQRPPK